MIQFSKFPDGGFVLHKVDVSGQKYSAWFTETGVLLDAERIGRNGVTYAVPHRNKNVRAMLKIVGNVYVGRTA